jgi:aminoglycoside 3-N-acetyltransferase
LGGTVQHKISTSDVKAELARVITGDDEVVVIFSGIWMFGSLLGVPGKEIPRYILDTICESIGKHRTVLLPTYTYEFTRTRIYDPQTSQPETGVLPMHALTRPEFTRTLNPLNSYAVSGPKTAEILAIKEETLWGDTSVMGWFDKVNARICVLGEPWHEACTHFHRAEEKLQVPYRYYKTFPGMLYENGSPLRAINATMYVRPLNVKLMRDYTQVAPVMDRYDLILRGSNANFPIESALARDIVKASSELLEKDPLAFVSNKAEILAWIKTTKRQEIASLVD